MEDDAVQALDIASGLLEAGASIIGPAASLDEAAQLITEQPCTAAVLDLRVGNRNATSFAQGLLRKRIPFILCTGYPDSAFFSSESAGYKLVSKPVEIALVIRELAALIDAGNRVGQSRAPG
ncbi:MULTISPECIES: hypothetical protein [Rhodomicrobium]|uniref:hypothetical protein n=1 Tax=Rhodomicrobium TaxID=1068 RepID=UPI001483BD38|nr:MULTISPECIES: hypothetical protein [Rhodomicrobium]